MLTQNELTQFKTLIRGEVKPINDQLEKVGQRLEKVEQRLEKVEKGQKGLTQRMGKVEKKLDKVIDLFDDQDVRLGNRLTRLETHLSLPSIPA